MISIVALPGVLWASTRDFFLARPEVLFLLVALCVAGVWMGGVVCGFLYLKRKQRVSEER